MSTATSAAVAGLRTVRRLGPVLLLTAAVAASAAAVPAAASAAGRTPRLIALRCVPSSACASVVRVRIGRQVQLRGTRLALGMRVSFRWPRGALATALHRGRAGWVARVPAGTAPGTVSVTVRDRAGRRSNARRMRVLAQPPVVVTPPPATAPAPTSLPAAFTGTGMWIWQLEKSDGGDLDAIAARARTAGLSTVFVKAADGPTPFGQYGSLLVGGLHQRGLRVCAWQYVYGTDPDGEAQAAAAAIAAGADCFVVDAESQYEGRYAAAQRYMTALRAAVGPTYPVGLTSFPYVDYHPNLPYSVFLAPGNAQANLPQVYWKDIGDTVDAASAHAYAHNRVYLAPIAPLGQSYDDPPPEDMARFRAIWAAYGAGGLSWWSWQASTDRGWTAVGPPAPAAAAVADPGWPALGKGAKGDEVVWLQEHLRTFSPAVTVTGRFDDATVAGVQQLQTARGLPPTGTTDATTWQAVLQLAFAPVDWTAAAPATASAARASAHGKREIPPPDARG